MNIQHAMEEYELELDDMRWYLSLQEAQRLVSYADKVEDLARQIWRGRLESDLYHMAERYVEELQDRLERGFMDEPEVHKILGEVRKAKRTK